MDVQKFKFLVSHHIIHNFSCADVWRRPTIQQSFFNFFNGVGGKWKKFAVLEIESILKIKIQSSTGKNPPLTFIYVIHRLLVQNIIFGHQDLVVIFDRLRHN